MEPGGQAQPDTVELWIFRLERTMLEQVYLASTLAPDETRRASIFVHDVNRRYFVAAHGLVRQVLATYLGCPPQAVPIAVVVYGKPHLAPCGSNLWFNLTHAGGLAVIAVAADAPVGVDVEPIRPLPELAELASCCLAASEQALLQSLPQAQHARAFLTCWTRKEAVLKACGLGLTVDPASVTVGLRANYARTPLSSGAAPRRAWRLRNIAPWPGFVGAVAADSARCLVRHADPPAHTAPFA